MADYDHDIGIIGTNERAAKAAGIDYSVWSKSLRTGCTIANRFRCRFLP